MSTVIVVVSLAYPSNDGVVWFDGDSGWSSVTVGEAVSTVNLTGALVPVGLPSELGWLATAVYCPLGSVGLALPELQLPPAGVAVAVATMAPVAVVPL